MSTNGTPTPPIGRSVEDGLCAFCGHEADNADLMDEIHVEIETLVALDPGDDGFEDAYEAVRRRFLAS